MKSTAAEVIKQAAALEFEQTLLKTAFLSYYISMYSSVNRELGMGSNGDVTIEEIFDFMQDLRHEGQEYVPDITREDIALSFFVLKTLGICKDVCS